jgi:hypothetical protein
MRVLGVMFFAGLVGCVLVIVVSWIQIFSDGFSNSGNPSDSHH